MIIYISENRSETSHTQSQIICFTQVAVTIRESHILILADEANYEHHGTISFFQTTHRVLRLPGGFVGDEDLAFTKSTKSLKRLSSGLDGFVIGEASWLSVTRAACGWAVLVLPWLRDKFCACATNPLWEFPPDEVCCCSKNCCLWSYFAGGGGKKVLDGWGSQGAFGRCSVVVDIEPWTGSSYLGWKVLRIGSSYLGWKEKAEGDDSLPTGGAEDREVRGGEGGLAATFDDFSPL